MSENLGPLSYGKNEEQIFLGREIAQHRDYSEETARRIDGEVQVLIQNAYNIAKRLLEENIDVLHKLAEVLLEKETVQGSELDALIASMKPGFKFPTPRDEDISEAPEVQAEA
jgi:cell division protease FtsH